MSEKLDINNLEGKKVLYLNRTADMLCIGFDEWCMLKNMKGELHQVSKYRLHIQCFWRIINLRKNKIIFSQLDLYENESCMDSEEKKLFDNKSKNWSENNCNLHVKTINMNAVSDLCIDFDNGDRLEVFVDSLEQESWRYIECLNLKSKHLIATGSEVEII